MNAEPTTAAGWRDIKSAPRDGTRVLIWRRGCLPQFARYDQAHPLLWRTGSGPMDCFHSPTHWLPADVIPSPEGEI